jgi:transmembrane sensor
VVSERGGPDPENDPTYAEAADWFARLHDGEISAEEILEWQRLMASKPPFAAAYARIEGVWNAIGEVRSPALAAPEKAQNDPYDGSISVSEWLSTRPSTSSRWRTSGLLAASVAVIAAATLWVFGAGSLSGTVLQTPAGQNQAFILADGSRLNLGANTHVEVTFEATARSINLSRGEAFFAVAKDPKRPFTVRAGGATATAVGTEFSVNRGPGQVVVAVIEGRVLVGSSAAANDSERAVLETKQLKAGEEILVNTGVAGSRGHLGEVTAGIGWQDGRLAFQSEPLSRILEDVNRYASKPILLDDPSIGDLMITGTVVQSEMKGWLASLEKSLPVRVVEDSQRITIRSR